MTHLLFQFELKRITAEEVRFLMVGGTFLTSVKDNPVPYLSEKQWAQLEELAQSIPVYHSLATDFEKQ